VVSSPEMRLCYLITMQDHVGHRGMRVARILGEEESCEGLAKVELRSIDN